MKKRNWKAEFETAKQMLIESEKNAIDWQKRAEVAEGTIDGLNIKLSEEIGNVHALQTEVARLVPQIPTGSIALENQNLKRLVSSLKTELLSGRRRDTGFTMFLARVRLFFRYLKVKIDD